MLQDASGQPVPGFRAPDFPIGAGNLWAVGELRAAGFTYDSSIVPTDIHDVYGMTNVSEAIFRWPNGLIEFPLPVRRILKKCPLYFCDPEMITQLGRDAGFTRTEVRKIRGAGMDYAATF
ncbi:MAG: hypothetical protein Kow0074_24420 [Candidatus Zixiibacteriota bacterium]